MKRNEQILSEVQKRFSPHDAHLVSKISTFIDGAKWADENPNTDDIETVLAYTYKGLGWLAENIEADMGTTRELALGCIETLQFLCNDIIMELRNKKIHANV